MHTRLAARCQAALLDLIQISELIATHRFSEESAGVPVSIDLPPDVETAITEALPSHPRSLSAHTGLLLAALGSGSIVDGLRQIHAATKNWRTFAVDRLATPPALALLALLAANAREMREDESLAENNFYGRMKETASCDLNEEDFGGAYREMAWDVWQSLVDWLDAWEGERGDATVSGIRNYRTLNDLKTAEKFWAINLALSQVDLREAERSNLERMFSYYQMDPGSAAPAEIMRQALNDWILVDRFATAHLKRSWKSADRRSVIVDAATKLLTKWDGAESDVDAAADPGDAASRRINARLSYAVSHVAFKRQVSLRLILRHRDPIAHPLSLAGSTSEDPADGSGATIAPRSVSLRAIAPGISEFDDPDGSAARDLLAVRCDLTVSHPDGDLTVMRPPRPLVPFRWDDSIGAFMEVERFSLGARHSLLLFSGTDSDTALAVWVRGLLDRHATRPVVVASSNRSGNVPMHWVYFGDFRIESVPDIPAPLQEGEKVSRSDAGLLLDLEPFRCAPVATLVLNGGLRIPGRHRARWLRSRPPDITAVVGTHGEDFALEVASDEHGVLHSLPIHGTSTTIHVSSLDLPEGRFSVALRHGRQTVALERFRLVDPETPSRYSVHRTPMGHVVSRPDTLPIVSAQAITDDMMSRIAWVDGLAIVGDHALLTNQTSASAPHRLPTSPTWGVPREDKDDNQPGDTAVVRAPTASCLDGGGHYRIYPLLGRPGDPKPKDQRSRCKICKRYWPAERRRPAKSPIVKERVVTPPHAAGNSLPTSIEIPPPSRFDVGPVFDAMCYLREGTAEDLRRLVLGLGGGNLEIHEILPSLHALGHCDVRYDRDMRPAAWRIAPTTLVSLAPGKAYIVGFRSSHFLERVTSLSEQLGTTHSVIDNHGLPSHVELVAKDVEMLQRFASLLHDESVQGPSRLQVPDLVELARCVPPLSTLESLLEQSGQPAARKVEFWDHELTRWIPTADFQRAGAYKFSGHSVTYGWQQSTAAQGQRRFIIGTHSIVKHLEARRLDRPLIYFDQQQGALCVRQGADLPPLLHRIATAASGRLPIRGRDATSGQRVLTYAGISMSLAEAIVDRMMA